MLVKLLQNLNSLIFQNTLCYFIPPIPVVLTIWLLLNAKNGAITSKFIIMASVNDSFDLNLVQSVSAHQTWLTCHVKGGLRCYFKQFLLFAFKIILARIILDFRHFSNAVYLAMSCRILGLVCQVVRGRYHLPIMDENAPHGDFALLKRFLGLLQGQSHIENVCFYRCLLHINLLYALILIDSRSQKFIRLLLYQLNPLSNLQHLI